MLRTPTPINLCAENRKRRGAFLVLAFFCLAVCLTFVAFTVDIGFLSLTKTRMQNAVDAAALAAAQEITNAVNNAPQDVENITLYVEEQARQVAASVAELNGVFIDPVKDVRFGQRKSDGNGGFETEWDSSPYNVVKVTARRESDEPGEPDGKLRLFFAGVTGDRYAKVHTEAVAYVEARDLVVVHDFSLSMSYDSYFNNESTANLSNAQIEENLRLVWDDLQQQCNFGSLTFEPRYMTLSKSQNGVTSTVTFRYDRCDVTTTANLKTVQVTYSSGSPTSHNVSGNSANNLGANSRDITRVTVTSTKDNPAETMDSNGITVTFQVGRKSANVSASPNKLRNLNVTFTDGSTASLSWSSSNGPTSYNYSSSKEISSVTIRRTGSSSYSTFNASPATTEIVQVFDDNNSEVQNAFDLGAYPANSGNWNGFINHCRNTSYLNARGYREMYGGLGLVNYILQSEYGNHRWPQLGQTRHYPFHSIKEGHELLCNFLGELGFDDHLGMVSYDETHRVEQTLNEIGRPNVDITSQPITNDYAAINNLMKYKQAAHYGLVYTNMGGGLKRAIQLLDDHKRPGSRPTIILMTDGNANRMDSGENGTLPSGWNWNSLLDYNNDGFADYTTSDNYKRNVLKTAYDAYMKGYTIHTMSVGASGDVDLMRAVAHLGNGHFINVPGGSSVSEMEDVVRAAFHKIASFVPPAKLLQEPEGE